MSINRSLVTAAGIVLVGYLDTKFPSTIILTLIVIAWFIVFVYLVAIKQN